MKDQPPQLWTFSGPLSGGANYGNYILKSLAASIFSGLLVLSANSANAGATHSVGSLVATNIVASTSSGGIAPLAGPPIIIPYATAAEPRTLTVSNQKWGHPGDISPEKNPPIIFMRFLAVAGWGVVLVIVTIKIHKRHRADRKCSDL